MQSVCLLSLHEIIMESKRNNAQDQRTAPKCVRHTRPARFFRLFGKDLKASEIASMCGVHVRSVHWWNRRGVLTEERVIWVLNGRKGPAPNASGPRRRFFRLYGKQWTMSQIAEAMGVTYKTVQYWAQRGEISERILEGILEDRERLAARAARAKEAGVPLHIMRMREWRERRRVA